MDQHVLELLLPVGVLSIIGIAIITLTKTITDYRLKRKMIDNGKTDNVADFFKAEKDNRYPALKWGLVILFGGIGLIILELVPTGPDSPLPFGILATFVAIGFLLYFFIVKREIEKESQK